jgi:DNA-directed RNA polymerase specialized sigma24 family protein
MVLDISAADFFGLVGHDGSQIAFPMLPDPMARRGLHIQECITACMKLGNAVTPIELFPVIQATTPGEDNIIVLFGDDESANWRCFEQTIQASTGVLEGIGRRCLHAVAYDHGMIFDPDGDQYPYSRPACESRGFHPRRAWRVDLLHSPPPNPSISELLRKDHTMSSYDCDLTSKIPKALDREQNERLYARVMAGDDKAREEMIEGNMPLVIAKVDAYVGCYPQAAYLRDDLHSAGFLALVKAVNTMAEHDQPSNVNPTGYISVAITHEITRATEKESAMGLTNVPESEEGPVSNRDVPEVGHDIPDSTTDVNESAVQGLFELRDMLESCCESDKERTLVRMREEGYSDREIAETLGLPHITTFRLRKELEERFNQKCRELEE